MFSKQCIITGTIAAISTTTARCNGNESRYCRKAQRYNVSQNIHTKARKCQVVNVKTLKNIPQINI